ncbi:MAG: hypothetical protein JWM98_2265 [Thermoleophilia bacterium]|nr:hypothetical protein [Thermoleophilia bacterium]
MDLPNQPIRGIVEVMDDPHRPTRGAGLGLALQRLSAAREQRGPVGVLDPFEVVPAEERRDAAEPVRSGRRTGLFTFSDRARRSVGGGS